MNNDLTIIVIDKYKGQRVTFSMPDDGKIDIWKTVIVKESDTDTICTHVGIDLSCSSGIEIKKEEAI